MTVHKEKPYFIITDTNHPLKSDWPNIKEPEPVKELEDDCGED